MPDDEEDIEAEESRWRGQGNLVESRGTRMIRSTPPHRAASRPPQTEGARHTDSSSARHSPYRCHQPISTPTSDPYQSGRPYGAHSHAAFHADRNDIPPGLRRRFIHPPPHSASPEQHGIDRVERSTAYSFICPPVPVNAQFPTPASLCPPTTAAVRSYPPSDATSSAVLPFRPPLCRPALSSSALSRPALPRPTPSLRAAAEWTQVDGRSMGFSIDYERPITVRRPPAGSAARALGGLDGDGVLLLPPDSAAYRILPRGNSDLRGKLSEASDNRTLVRRAGW